MPVRGLRYHVHVWGEPALASTERPPLVLLHGWMDVGASFQFVVDELARIEHRGRWVIAPDWRGFGRTEALEADTFWFPDYMGDLDALLDALIETIAPQGVIDLVGHSMGGHIAMSYAGARPQRIRRLVNIEGFGLPATRPEAAPGQLLRWLDSLRSDDPLRPYASAEAVAARLMKNNPLLTADKAAWLAQQWARQGTDGLWHIRANAAHKRTSPTLYHVDEMLEFWKCITAPLLCVKGDQSILEMASWWGPTDPRSELDSRLRAVSSPMRKVVIPQSGHMLHHDQPQLLAAELAQFLA